MANEFAKAINEVSRKLALYELARRPMTFYTAGTGVPDEVAVDYFKHTNMYVMTRDGTMWQRGEIVKDN